MKSEVSSLVASRGLSQAEAYIVFRKLFLEVASNLLADARGRADLLPDFSHMIDKGIVRTMNEAIRDSILFSDSIPREFLDKVH